MYDLTLQTPAYVAGKYGQALSQGSGSTQDVFVGLTDYTMEGWVKNIQSGIRVAFGSGGCAWVGINQDGTARASYGNSQSHDLSGPVINDGAWHHVAVCVSKTNGGALWVDGVLAASAGPVDGPISKEFGVGFFGGVGGYDWGVGNFIDEVAITAGIKYTATFTPGPVLNNQAGLRAVWHMDGDGVNSAGMAQAPTGDTTPPSAITDIVFSNITNSGFTATWAAATDNVGVVGYKFDDGSGALVDIGNVLTKTVTGKSAGTVCPVRVLGYDAAGNQATAYSESVTTAASAATFDATRVKFSPGNWDVQTSLARTICAGAYFETLFGGTSCTLSFDMTGLVAPYPVLAYRVDEYGPWQTVRLAATVNILIPAATAPQAVHFLRVEVIATSQAVNRWNGECTVKLTGITLDATKTLSLPDSLPLSGWYYGDSITEGVNTLNNSGDNTDRSSAATAWSYLSARALGAECGIIGFGSQGLTVGGAGNVPIFGQAYDKQFAGVARSFAKAPDYVVINQGTNDRSDITAPATEVLNGLISKLPSSTKIIVLRPFNGSYDAQWIAAIGACSAPARVAHVDTTGWFNTANAPDGLHPSAFENIWHIAPAATAAIKAVLGGYAPPEQPDEPDEPTQVLRTFSITLGNAAGAAANRTGLHVNLYDTPNAGAANHTDASGTLLATAQTTLVSGQTGYASVLDPATGEHWTGSVQVA